MVTITKKGIEKMSNSERERGRGSDRTLLETIDNFSGLSLYELARKTGWTKGHVDGTVRRLLNSKRVYIKVISRNGRRVELIYPIGQKPSDIVEVPIELLKVENPAWQEGAFIYALDNVTIGISGEEDLEWKALSCFSQRIAVSKTNGRLLLKIPENLVSFYHLNEKHRVVSVNGNNILITVSGDIIETKKYPS